MNKPNKPFVIEMDETKRDLVSVVDTAIQERKIPCYVLEMLLGDILSQVQEVARREREFANQSYLKQFATEENPTEENEEN
jgi:hypothetical protein